MILMTQEVYVWNLGHRFGPEAALPKRTSFWHKAFIASTPLEINRLQTS
jgi:hypothetical protein